MLGSLLKYEIKATSRTFLPLYGAMLIFAVINRIFVSITDSNDSFSGSFELPTGITMTIFTLIIFATFIMTFIVMLQRFHRNLLSDEGYLMNTLPVKTWKHITSKLLVSMMWIIITAIVTFLSICIVASFVPWTEFFTSLNNFAQRFYNEVGFSVYTFSLEAIIAVLLYIAVFILTIYASISLGHLSNRHRGLASFGAFLIITIAVQIISSIGLKIIETFNLTDWILTLPPQAAMHTLFFAHILINLIFGTIFFGITNYVLSRRLNLD